MKALKDLQVGESLPEITLDPVSRLNLIKFAGASGDYNPIHTIDEEAIKVGLPGIIAHGMWTMGNLTKLFTPYFAEGFLENFSIRFRGMVLLNDVITLRATVKEKQGDRLKFNVSAGNQQGIAVLKGEVLYQLYLT
ncbi:MaoC/PaaZ C-terminal domain-containing protein [Bacillus sp. EB600]|uniref:MaoC/PaaZ C-terminal domain-containing protein n=1 Tax=Bacillus sp. EB600 TaxID=2806345 RepID=UPI00210D57FB|nr:MaoC/PaaZ C-terminal domain-containing protein [Bacillus sp. EB600]MCQ6279228.1 dehydratase [Bacillus sp. EB600]